MTKNLHFLFKTRITSFIFILLLSFYYNNGIAQCAGQDNVYTVCDIPNASSQSINLFSLLLGTPVPGGIWNDDDLSGGLNTSTGILNAQVIIQSGVYNYTYTVSGIPGCIDTQSTITVTVGGYAGSPMNSATLCSDDTSFNLFNIFNTTTMLEPQSFGTWFNVTNNTGVNGSNINPNTLGVGTYQFTYTIAEIGSCVKKVSYADIRIIRAPEAGTPTNLLLCDSDNLTFPINFDLNNLLLGEDAGGRWTDVSGTTEITTTADHNVNIQNIYNTLGVGIYSFFYTVNGNSQCGPESSPPVRIIIERRLDFTGSTFVVNSDICENQIATAIYSGTITQGVQPIPNGQYNLTYQVSGPNGSTNTIIASFVGGVCNFSIPRTFFQQVGSYNVTVTNVSSVSSQGACTNIMNIPTDILNVTEKPNIDNANLVINPICQNQSAAVQMSNMSNLPDGNYQITYNLSGSNAAGSQTIVIAVVGGLSNFNIPSNLIPNAGNTTISITNIVNLTTGCFNPVSNIKIFVIRPIPNVATLVVSANDVCENQPVSVTISGLGTLTNVIIDYNLTGANTTATTQTISLIVATGTSSFTIPQAQLPNLGLTNISISYITNSGNSCGAPISNLSDGFRINPIPVAPTASNRSFCKNDNATVANLLPSGSQYKWYDSAASATPLSNSTLLISGNYYVSETNPTTGCTSTRTMITVVINELQTPTLNANGQNFCGLDKPTLQQLSNNTNASSTLVWFNAAANGNQLPNTTLLEEGETYYGFDFSSTTNCFSTNGLAVTVSLTNCINAVTQYDFFIPDGFSPNGDGVNDTFTIPKIKFLFPNYSLEIYNRYGNLMFKGDSNSRQWDGRSSESINLIDGIAPNGVYFYVINFNKDNKSPQQGRLYLNR